MKISEAKVGMSVRGRTKGGFEYRAKIKCIHDKWIYLDRSNGSYCNKHGGQWCCAMRSDGHLGSDSIYGLLIMDVNIVDYYL